MFVLAVLSFEFPVVSLIRPVFASDAGARQSSVHCLVFGVWCEKKHNLIQRTKVFNFLTFIPLEYQKKNRFAVN